MADRFRSTGGRSRPDVAELSDRFRELTLLLYDTNVSLKSLAARVYPYLAPDIEFKDPLAITRGERLFKVGLRGFHCVIHFDFDIAQLDVQLNDLGDGGRVLVDGIMNLRQLYFYTYPLRTLLVYDFVMARSRDSLGDRLGDRGGPSFQITRLEEMWSLGDLVENVPLIGRLYSGARQISGYILGGLFWLGCKVCPRE